MAYALAKRGETMTFEKERGITSVINDPRADPLMPTPFRKASQMSKKSLRLDNSSKILLRNVYEKRMSTKSALQDPHPTRFGFSPMSKKESQRSPKELTRNSGFRGGRSLSLAHDPSVLKIGSQKSLAPTLSPSRFSDKNELNNQNIGIKLPDLKKPNGVNTLIEGNHQTDLDSKTKSGTFEQYTQ